MEEIFMMTPCRTYLLALGCLIAASTSFAGEDAEHIFAKAKGYTVKVRNSVAVPFSGDTKGTFTGAGFVIDLKRHWIVTNAHVTSRSKSMLRVSSISKDYQSASPVFIDPYFDLAIIEVPDVTGLTEAKLDCDTTPTTGLPVGAFGHPWDYTYTGTKGIISGHTSNLKKFGDFLQTDAPINPGNSGGPLINLKDGGVVGINTAGLSDAQNMNYAVPIAEVCTVLNLLRDGKDPTPPDFPFSFSKDNDDKNTLKIAAILPVGKELSAQIGDIILAVGSKHHSVENEPQMLNNLRSESDKVEIYVRRDGKELKLTGKVKAVPNVFSKKGLSFSGLMIRREYNQEFLNFFGSDHMLSIEFVEGGGLAESRGISSCQQLISINGKAVDDITNVYEILKNLKTGENVTLSLKSFVGEDNHMFGYRDRTVPLEDLHWVSFEDNRAGPISQKLAEIK
jgi:serine protease Do